MPTLALKLALTPALIAAASLAGRRWGPAISGWLVGLPFTSGPIAFFLALAHGAPFAAAAATGTLAGALSQTAFCLAYAWLAVRLGTHRSAWPAALAAGTLAFAATTVLLARWPLSLAVLVPLVFFVLLLALWLMPKLKGPADESAPRGRWPQSPPARAGERAGLARCGPADEPMPGTAPTGHSPGAGSVAPDADWLPSPPQRRGAGGENSPRWDLPLRMAVATAFVVLLTALAPALGARLTGLLAPFPLFASVLAVFAHAQRGSAAAAGVLRGLLLGLFSFAGFFVALALLLVPAGVALAFAAAIAAALSVQGGTLWLLHSRSR